MIPRQAMVVRRRLALFVVMILLALLSVTYAAPPRPNPAYSTGAKSAAAGVCAQITAVPPSECAALVELYNATGGPQWADATSWLSLASAASPCDWHGVTCTNGHVVGLALAANRLQGVAPPGMCFLTLASADLAYNALFTARSDTQACLDRLDPDWAATQTAPLREVHPAAFAANSVQLAWTPIVYKADTGFYEVSYATAPDGPF